MNRYREEEKEQMETETQPETSVEEEKAVEPTPVEENETDTRVAELEEEILKLKDQYLRVLAEADNFRKRTNEERIRERKYASQNLLEKLVASIDIFDKAVSVKTEDEKLKNYLAGFTMINEMLKKILEDEGVKKIASLHQKFDPSLHHAVDTGWDENLEEDTILEEYQTGYTFKDRVLKPSLVKVNKKNKEETKNE